MKLVWTLAVATGLWSVQATAQTPAAYPSRPVRIVVPYPPAGPVDVLARQLSEQLAPALGQPFTVENRPGANGNIGNAVVAKSAPDGYTLLMTVDTSLTVNPSLYPQLGFDAAKDLKPVSLLVSFAQVLVVHTAVPAQSVAELLALARRNSLTYATGGNGSPAHLTTEAFLQTAGVKALHVPYKGNAPAVAAVLSGEVQFGFLASTAVLPHLQAGKLRALAVSSAKRSSTAPEIPTIAESGMPKFETEYGIVLALPARTPDAIVDTLQREFTRALQEPALRTAAARLGLEVVASNAAEVERRLKAETERWNAVVKAGNVRVE